MNDLQIEYFIAVVNNLSFTKAARELFVSQPAISRQILALEEDLGHTLFERTNKSVKLTEAGEMFYRFFLEYKTELNNIKVHAQIVSEKRQRILKLGIVNLWDISPLFLRAMEAFKTLHSQVKVQIRSYDIHEMEAALDSDLADIIMTIAPAVTEQKGISRELVGYVPRVLMYPRENTKNAANLKPTPADFKAATFLVAAQEERTFYAEDLVRGFCRPYGFAPKIQAVNSTDAMLIGVQCHMGVAIVDKWCREVCHPAFGWIELNSSHEINLMWKTKWEDPVLMDFAKCIKDAFEPVVTGK